MLLVSSYESYLYKKKKMDVINTGCASRIKISVIGEWQLRVIIVQSESDNAENE